MYTVPDFSSLGGILVINFAVVGMVALLDGGSGEIWAAERRGPVADAALMLAVPTTIALFFVKSKRANLVLLVLLNALVLLEAVAGAVEIWGFGLGARATQAMA